MPARDPWREVREAAYAHVGAADRPHLRALVDEYIEAMKAGAFARKAAEKEPFTKLRSSGRIVSNPMWEVHDREVRRGIALAKALDLTGPGEEVERDRFAALDGDDKPVSLDERRRRKSSAQKRGA